MYDIEIVYKIIKNYYPSIFIYKEIEIYNEIDHCNCFY